MSDQRRFYEVPAAGVGRSAPAALRNREPIAEVLREWLPERGLVLEIASGTGQHTVYFGSRFPNLEWQPSDMHRDALASIEAWREAAGQPNVRAPIEIDASSPHWPIARADAVLNVNMVHISPWSAALGLVAGAASVLRDGGPLILYGPWLKDDIPTAASNIEFDADLKARDPAWGLRRVEDFEEVAAEHGLGLEASCAMPANNLMLLFRSNRTNR